MIYLDHAAMKQMAEQKSGVIINIGSITGEEGCDTKYIMEIHQGHMSLRSSVRKR